MRYAVYDCHGFRIFADVFAFFAGFSPEIGAYGTAYFRDVLSTRTHTKALLNLILSLNAVVPGNGLYLTQKATIVSACGDNLTGVYHATDLARNMPNSKHRCLLLASHFLLLEFPTALAQEILSLVLEV
jgi:pimeloyl-ACP methyl ester carboxylesterase